jgi:hypothetical protein
LHHNPPEESNMLNRQTFAQIVARVRDVVPARPNPDDPTEKFLADTERYDAWRNRQYGWVRADGSEAGHPGHNNGQPHGERAARLLRCERHLRTIPRHNADAASEGIARHEPRSNKRRFSRPPFVPDFMRRSKESTPRVVVGSSTVTRVETVGVNPIAEVYQQEIREVSRRFHKSSYHATPSLVAPLPRRPWRATPLRPPMALPVALCSPGNVMYVELRN